MFVSLMFDGERVVAIGLIDVAVLLRVCFESKMKMKMNSFQHCPQSHHLQSLHEYSKKASEFKKVLRITHASTGSHSGMKTALNKIERLLVQTLASVYEVTFPYPSSPWNLGNNM